MIKHTINLPFARLQFSFKKRRGFRAKKYLRAKYDEVAMIRKGSRFSRFFKTIFEHKRIKALLGGTLAAIVIFSSSFSAPVSALSTLNQDEVSTFPLAAVELITKQTEIRLPVEALHITQKYSFFHTGVDLDGVTGDPIYPIMEGRIESVINDRFGLGKHIIVNHGSGLKSVYGHLDKIEVEAGQEVSPNDEIGEMGNTGHSFGDHLHLEVFDNGKRINPAILLKI